MRKKLSIFMMGLTLTLLGSALTACGGGNGSNSNQGNSTFQGTWLGVEILEFRKNKDPKVICDNVENSTNNNNELSIDGYVIEGNGLVYDFSINESVSPLLWKVRLDGTTYDNMILQNKDSIEGAAELVGHSMKKISDDKISSDWQIKISKGGVETGHVEFVRMSDAEITEIRKVFNDCVKDK